MVKYWRVQVQFHAFLTLELDGGESLVSCLGPLYPQYPWIVGWVGPRASLDMVAIRKNPHPLAGINPCCPACNQLTTDLATLAPLALWYVIQLPVRGTCHSKETKD